MSSGCLISTCLPTQPCLVSAHPSSAHDVSRHRCTSFTACPMQPSLCPIPPGHTSPPTAAPAQMAAVEPVVLLDDAAAAVSDVTHSFHHAWWRRRGRLWSSRGPATARHHLPPRHAVRSVGLRRRFSPPRSSIIPTCSLGGPAGAAAGARIRCGCLVTREHLARHGICGVTSPVCLCCGAAAEDESHVLAGCEARGVAPHLPALRGGLAGSEPDLQGADSTASSCRVGGPPPPPTGGAHSRDDSMASPATCGRHRTCPGGLHIVLTERTASVLNHPLIMGRAL